MVAEQIQSGNYGSTSRKTQNRNEEDVSLVLQGSSRRVESSPPVRIQRSAPPRQPTFNNQGSEGRRRFENTRNREFTPLGDPLEQILAVLIAQKKITELAPPSDPKGRRYDPSKKCTYHSGSPGHDTQECWSLKHKIQNMIDSGEIMVEQPKSPNVKVNPLPEHNGGGVNTIEAESKVLAPPSEKLAKHEEFLQEVVQQFETKCCLPGQSAVNEQQNEDGPSQESQQIMPFINWAELTIPKGAVDEVQGQVAVIIKEVHGEDSPSISHILAELTIANWTMEPVVSKRG